MTKTSPLIRFFLDRDDDSHWYLIPVSARQAWQDWVADPESEMPDGVSGIDDPSGISFADWAEGDGDIDTTYAAPVVIVPKTRTISLKDLVGPHLLQGVDTPTVGEHKLADWIRFKLGGQVYYAREDGDGYRSYLDRIEETDAQVEHTFRGVKVIGRMKTERRDEADYSGDWDVLQLVSVKTGKVVLECGTSNCSDYYPSWEVGFWPEHLKS